MTILPESAKMNVGIQHTNGGGMAQKDDLNFSPVKLPKKISPCSIREAVVEFRFEPKIPCEMVTGVVAHLFKDEYLSVESLPVTELPMAIRNNDPGLKFSPELRLKSSHYKIQVGPRSLAVICPKEYTGWRNYFGEIKKIFGKVNRLDVVARPVRIGLRYIAFFEGVDIFSKTNVELKMSKNSLIGQKNILMSEFDYNNFGCVVQMNSNIPTINNNLSGSSIDIDIAKTYKKQTGFADQYLQHIEHAHKTQKNIFFSLLKDDFLENYNPEYDQ